MSMFKVGPTLNRIFVFAAIILFWELTAYWVNLKPNPMPPPSAFLPDIINNNFQIGIGSQATNIFTAMFASIFRVIVGLVVSVIIGIPIGLMVAKTKFGSSVLLPIVQLFAPIAPIAWIPIALAIFGIGNFTAIFIVFMGVFFLFVLSIVNAVNSISQEMHDSASVLGFKGFDYLFKFIVPAIFPQIVSSMRINLPAAWMAVLAAEMTGLRDGLGAIVMTGRNLYDYNIVMFGVLFIAIIGLLFDTAISLIKDRYFWW